MLSFGFCLLVIQTIEDYTPGLLNRAYPTEIISKNIQFRLFPYSIPQIPTIVGRVPYSTVVKVIQLGVKSILLPPGSELRILSSRLEGDVGNGETESKNSLNPVTFTVRWRTASQSPQSSENEFPSSFSYGINLARSLQLLPHEYPVLTGNFEFQFNESYTQITVFTITDLEYLSKPAQSPAIGAEWGV